MLFALTGYFLRAQSENAETRVEQRSKFQIGIAVSPDLCYRSLRNNGGGQTGE